MKNTANTQNKKNQELDVEVLYQKLGDRWFAFSLIGDEVFMSPISDDLIEEIRTTNPNSRVNSNEAV